MKKIIMSAGTLVFAGALVASATGAFFSDVETSSANTFTAGSIDLTVDSEAHYNGAICIPDGNGGFIWDEGSTVGWPIAGTPCEGTWAATDLGAATTFFDLDDVKPGDVGENTISLHVTDNDAWGRFIIGNVEDVDNSCTEPEEEASTTSSELCTVGSPEGTTAGSGELAENTTFSAWIDDGAIPGFQGSANDATEGDNIMNGTEVQIIAPGTVDPLGETHNIWTALAAYRASLDAACDATDLDGDGHTPNATDACNGLADDGRMVGDVTYYFGLDWEVLDSVGNEAQTDSLSADLTFEVVQHRNNPGQSF